MTHSTLLTLLLTTPCATSLLPLAERLLPHLQQIARLLEDPRTQPVTPTATRDFELRLQELLRHVGLNLADWTFQHLEAEPLPDRLHHDGQRYRRRDPCPTRSRLSSAPSGSGVPSTKTSNRATPACSRWRGGSASSPAPPHPLWPSVPPGGWPNIRKASRSTCWPATTMSAGRPRPYAASPQPSPMAWRRTAPQPRSSRFWSGCREHFCPPRPLPPIAGGGAQRHSPAHAYGAGLQRGDHSDTDGVRPAWSASWDGVPGPDAPARPGDVVGEPTDDP